MRLNNYCGESKPGGLRHWLPWLILVALPFLLVIFATAGCGERSAPLTWFDNPPAQRYIAETGTPAQQGPGQSATGEKHGLEKGRTCIVITFDDGNDTDYNIAFPLMAERGIRGVSYINSSTVGQQGYLSWEQVSLLARAGWDIGSHTATHPWLTSLSDEDIHREMISEDDAFLAKGLGKPIHHAYPFTDCDRRVAAVVGQYRLTARQGEHPPRTFDWSEPDWLFLPGWRIYMQDAESYSRVLTILDRAVAGNDLLVLYTHRLSEQPGPYDTHPVYFEALLDHIITSGVQTATLSELVALY